MTTRERIDLLARVYPRLFPRRELLRMVRAQLGHVDALDRWILRDGVRIRARAPRTIYHICAGNLVISAVTSLMHGLVLGAKNIVKLPSERDDSFVRREILDFVRRLPAALRKLVESHAQLDEKLPRSGTIDAVVAFGSDATMQSLRAKTAGGTKFIGHGHAVSFLWIENPDTFTPREARACAIDVLTYDQLGCLSPQAIYFPPRSDVHALGDQLARALEVQWRKQVAKPARPISVAARIAEARDVAHALGQRVWLPREKHFGWTIIHDPNPAFEPSPLHGVIYLRPASGRKLSAALASVAGKISTVGISGKISPDTEAIFLRMGATRFCPAGKMQFPPLTWHHDGRAPLADLVTWVDAEEKA
jgi:hypothetical protein